MRIRLLSKTTYRRPDRAIVSVGLFAAVAVLATAMRAIAGEPSDTFLPGFARAVAWSPDGALLVAVRPTELRVYDGRTLSLRQTVRSLDPAAGRRLRLPAATAVFTPDGRMLATAAFDRGVTLWDTATWNRLLQIPNTGGVTSLAFVHDGTGLAGAGPSAALAIWDTGTGTEKWLARAAPSGVAAIAVSPDDTWLVAGTMEGEIELWSLGDQAVAARSQRQAGAVLSVAFSPDGSTIAYSAACVDIGILRTDDKPALPASMEYTLSAAVQRNAAAVSGLALVVANAASFRSLGLPRIPDTSFVERRKVDFYCPVRFSPDGKQLGAVRHSETLGRSINAEIYDVASAQLQSRVGGAMSTLAFAPDGSRVVASGILHLLIFDPKTGGASKEFR
jgi:WD40 repeat protein